MGGVFSTTKALKEAKLGTPSKNQQRLINSEFDPRSPSDDVVRTPIAVTATPVRCGSLTELCITPVSVYQIGHVIIPDLDPRSPTTDYTRTPIQVAVSTGDTADPRSPSAEYTRTPIYAAATKEQTVNPLAPSTDDAHASIHLSEPEKQIQATQSPSVDHTCIPPIATRGNRVGTLVSRLEEAQSNSITNIDSIQAIPELDFDLGEDIINRSRSEPDLSKDYVQLIRCRNVPESISFRESTPKKTERNKVASYQVLSHEDLTSRSIMVKGMSPLGIKDTKRSPLSVRNHIDVNAPRIIVQSKQKTKLSLSMKVTKIHNDASKTCAPRPPSKYQALEATDKENRIKY